MSACTGRTSRRGRERGPGPHQVPAGNGAVGVMEVGEGRRGRSGGAGGSSAGERSGEIRGASSGARHAAGEVRSRRPARWRGRRLAWRALGGGVGGSRRRWPPLDPDPDRERGGGARGVGGEEACGDGRRGEASPRSRWDREERGEREWRRGEGKWVTGWLGFRGGGMDKGRGWPVGPAPEWAGQLGQ